MDRRRIYIFNGRCRWLIVSGTRQIFTGVWGRRYLCFMWQFIKLGCTSPRWQSGVGQILKLICSISIENAGRNYCRARCRRHRCDIIVTIVVSVARDCWWQMMRLLLGWLAVTICIICLVWSVRWCGWRNFIRCLCFGIPFPIRQWIVEWPANNRILSICWQRWWSYCIWISLRNYVVVDGLDGGHGGCQIIIIISSSIDIAIVRVGHSRSHRCRCCCRQAIHRWW